MRIIAELSDFSFINYKRINLYVLERKQLWKLEEKEKKISKKVKLIVFPKEKVNLNQTIVYRKADGLEVHYYALLFLKGC